MNRFSFTPTAQFPLACRVLLGFALAGTAGAQTSPAPVTAEPSKETLHLSPFQVNTTQEKGYAGTHAMGASRFNIALVDVPQSVVVLNQQMLSDVVWDYIPVCVRQFRHVTSRLRSIQDLRRNPKPLLS